MDAELLDGGQLREYIEGQKLLYEAMNDVKAARENAFTPLRQCLQHREGHIEAGSFLRRAKPHPGLETDQYKQLYYGVTIDLHNKFLLAFVVV